MDTNTIIANLKILGFNRFPHSSIKGCYTYLRPKYYITVIINLHRIIIKHSYTQGKIRKEVRTNHKQGLNYVVKTLHSLQEQYK